MVAQPQPTSSPDDGIVKVTLNTVYQGLLTQSIDLAEIKGTLLLMSQNMTHVIEVGKDHEARLRELERNSVGDSELDDVTRRVGALERDTIDKKSLWQALGVMVMAVGVIVTIAIAVLK